MNWNDLRYFLAVSRTGNLTSAGINLKCSPATVSRRLEFLEESIGLKLFSRHQTGYVLTDDGVSLLHQAETAETAMFKVERAAAGKSEAASGLVKIATAENIANHLIIPKLPEFRKKFPDLSIELNTSVSAANLMRREADIALTLKRPRHATLLIKKVGELGFAVYGAPNYTSSLKGTIEEQIKRATFVAWAEEYGHLDLSIWLTDINQNKLPALITHSIRGQLLGAKAGLGLAILPCLLGDNESGLQRFPYTLEGRTQDIWLVTHQDLRHSMRVVAVFEFLESLIHENAKSLSGKNL
jgi:DNA-binding transcriptional LysR family regulator